MPASSEPQSQSNPDEPEADAVPMNRAERRAKGKVKPQQHLSVGKINPHGTSNGHNHRQYSNRRSGGGR
jgi:hypothetical protein